MAVVARWDEYTGTAAYASPSATGISNTNFGSSDTPNLTASSAPITANTNSFFKKHVVRFTTISGGESVNTFYFAAYDGLSSTGVLDDGVSSYIYRDLGTAPDQGAKTNTTAPSATSITTTFGSSSSVPLHAGTSTENFPAPPTTNIAGGPCTAANEGSNFFVHQVLIHSTATAGTTVGVGFRYVVST